MTVHNFSTQYSTEQFWWSPASTTLVEHSCVLCVYSAVPDAPQSVQIVSSLPTELRVAVEPPDEDGGMPVTGYRVEFEDQAQDFDLSKISSIP